MLCETIFTKSSNLDVWQGPEYIPKLNFYFSLNIDVDGHDRRQQLFPVATIIIMNRIGTVKKDGYLDD